MTTLTRVQEQYEVLPYPHRDPERELELLRQTTLCELPRIQALAWGRPCDLSTLRVLDAGCGTGDNTVFLAEQLRDTGAEVVALDFSEASLEVNRARLAKRGLTNVRHVLAPIEEAPTLGLGEFDFIVCTGVLHHLASPLEGLSALRTMLKPDGIMGLMVYARYGKRTIEGLPPQQRSVRSLLDTPLFRGEITQSDAGAYDLLLHTQDRPYTVPEIHEWTADAGMRVLDWSVPRAYDPSTYLAGVGMSHLDAAERAATAELMHGGMTKHEFFVERDDAPARPMPAADDPSAVPVWTGYDFADTVRAVLAQPKIGPEFRCTFGPERDVAVPADALGKYFMGAVDGATSVGGILEGARRVAGSLAAHRVRSRWLEFAEAFRAVAALAMYESPRT